MTTSISGLYGPLSEIPQGRRPSEQFRFDVDGFYPQMAASGVVRSSSGQSVSWMAKLRATSRGRYSGSVVYRQPAALSGFPYTTLQITVRPPATAVDQPELTVVFRAPGLPRRTVNYRRISPHFDKVVLEYDYVEGISPVTVFNTGSHPNRPATLLVEDLSIETVYRRAGFDVELSGAGSVRLTGAGANQAWSDTEMHDAMQTAWSRYADLPQWAMWVFFANRYEDADTGQGDTGMGGIMFDSIGRERQGTAIFYDSFISELPPGDPKGAAHVSRMRFWTAVHEMGHAFNLLHSWQKALGTPWIPLANEPEARSYMNYPYRVAGKVPAFFANFEYRFTNSELLFMRHAPRHFVQMGNAAFAQSHGFESTRVAEEPGLTLEVRFNRPQPVFDFMEPVVAELKLKNVSSEPRIVDAAILADLHDLAIQVTRDGGVPRQYRGFATYCRSGRPVVLAPGEAIYNSLYIPAGANGQDLAEPGYYTVQAMLSLDDQDVLSPPARLRITPPRGYDDAYLAQDFFSENVARAIAFDGTRVLGSANAILHEVADRLKGRAVARHAHLALAMPLRAAGKVLDLAAGKVRSESGKPEAAAKELSAALLTQPAEAAETLGHVDYRYYVDRLTELLSAGGRNDAALDAQEKLLAVFQSRKVKAAVLAAIRDRSAGMTKGGKNKKRK